MTFMPRCLFGRLVLGLSVVALCAIGVGAMYLYTRFHEPHSYFYEGTLQGYASELTKDLRVVNGVLTADVQDSTIRRIASHGGYFIVLDSAGQRLAGSTDITKALFPLDEGRYFRLPANDAHPELYGISRQIPRISPPAYVQIVFPVGDIVFQTVVHNLMKEVAWIWIPFLLAVLLTNILVVRIGLGRLARTVEEAKHVQPAGAMVSLSEEGLPDDILALVRTVNEAFDRLRDGYRMQEEFVADMAHELRTPLAVMMVQLASVDAPHARGLERDVSAMARLVEQLLDRARIGRLRIESPVILDLREVAREASAFLAPQVVTRGKMIEVVGEERPVLVSGGRDHIFRAVRNLIENAQDHAPESSLITVEVTDCPAIIVRDRGPGFPAPILDAERRRKGDVRSERRDGTGLGLSIVERTMMAHGGALDLRNEASGGGCAEMRFPPLMI